MSTVRHPLLGLAAVVVVLLMVLGTVGSFAQVFTPSVDASIRADRSGLLMAPGSDVTLHGIVVGQVRRVEPDGDRARLEVAFDPSRVEQVPSNVTADITAPTVFGAKYVELQLPRGPRARPVTEGTVIAAGSVSTEANSVLEGLHDLLTRVDVAQLNSGLGALSTTLNGRGQQLGDLLVALNTFLVRFNPSLPALGRDIRGTADVANTYADAAPDLLATLGNLSVTSGTLVDEQPAIATVLTDLLTTANDTRTLLDDNGPALARTLTTLRPTSAVLARYAPMYPCLFATTNQYRQDVEPVIGGDYPGIHTFTSLMPGSEGYKNPTDLPRTDGTVPPSCFGAPFDLSPSSAPLPHVRFDDGTSVYDKRTDDVELQKDPLPVILFGEAGKGLGR